MPATEPCPSTWWRYTCGLITGHDGLHRFRGPDVSADWNDAEAAAGFPRKRHS